MAMKDFPSYDVNPVVVDGIIRVRRVSEAGKLALVDEKTGQIKARYDVEESSGHEYQSFDNEKFTKIYHKNILAMSRLSHTSMKVLFYIFYQLDMYRHGNDWFTVVVSDAIEFCGFKSRQSVYDALNELLEVRAIFRKTGTLNFWINPNAFFNGSRVQYMEDRAKSKTK